MSSTVLDHEPHLALFVPDDDPLLFYRAIARIACCTLLPHGHFLLEINTAIHEETRQLFTAAGFITFRLSTTATTAPASFSERLRIYRHKLTGFESE